MFTTRSARSLAVRSSWLATLAACALFAGCAADAIDASDPLTEAIGSDYRSFGLARGTRETLVDGIASAENVMFTSSGRLFVTGDDGIYELTRDASKAITKTNLHPNPSCKFGGMVELGDALYVNCYDMTDSYLYVGALTEHPEFKSIFTLSGVALANGLAADAEDNLYITSTLQSSILRLRLAEDDPFKVISQQTWLASTGGGLPNGLKIDGDQLYCGDLFGSISRVSVRGKPNPPTPFVREFAWFDDMFVDARGILIADYFFGAIRAYDQRGIALANTALGTFTNPSAVVPANGRLGFMANDLIVTEKGANRVAIFHAQP